MAGTITKAQTRKLRTVASKRFGNCDCRSATGTTDAYVCDYHRWLSEIFGVASTRDLSFAQAGRAIDALEGKVDPAKKARIEAGLDALAAEVEKEEAPWKGRYDVGGAPGFITVAQADEIARLEDLLGWAAEPDHASPQLQAFIRRQFSLPGNVHVPIHGLANRQASSLITGLRRLLETRK